MAECQRKLEEEKVTMHVAKNATLYHVNAFTAPHRVSVY